MKSIVVVSSLTGNTLKVGDMVAYALDEHMETVKVEEMPDVSDYDLVVVGCWVDRATADTKAQEFIKTIRNKKVAFFVTLGKEPDSEHAEVCLKNIAALFDESNELVGQFICQGAVSLKMMEIMAKKFPAGHSHAMTDERRKRMEASWSHPDKADLQAAREYFTALKKRLEG
ncbi:flavodoxin family protein [Anaerovibrio sp.]|uniref:flavodoxin family protein n=1 Tax=Anaerovibrio sp. TaxID=1872532 RepID=UPI003F145FCB